MICSELNKLAHKLRSFYPTLTWGEAFRAAMGTKSIPKRFVEAPTSVFGVWSPKTHRALAGHFWALRISYKAAGDDGRALWAGRISSSLFASWEEGATMGFAQCFSPIWGEAARAELVDYFWSAYTADQTNRIIKLGSEGVDVNKVHLPRWEF